MQKKIVALAVAGLSTAAFAQTNVTIYGVADVSGQGYSMSANKAQPFSVTTAQSAANAGGNNTSQKVASGNVFALQNNSSLIGFKGTEDLGNGLRALFQAEANLNLTGTGQDSGGAVFSGTTSTTFGVMRDSYVGVNSKYGTGLAGFVSTPFRSALVSFDVLPGSTGSGRAEQMVGSMRLPVTGTSQALQLDSSVRGTAIAYAMPTLYGFDGSIAYTGSNNNGQNNNCSQKNASTDSAATVCLQSAFGFNLGWTGYGVNIKGAFQQANTNFRHDTTILADNTAWEAGSYTSYLVGAAYTGLPGLKASVVYARNTLGVNAASYTTTNANGAATGSAAWGANKLSNNQLYTGVSYRMGNWEPRLAATWTTGINGDGGGSQTGARQWVLNTGYYLSKRTQVYGLVSNLNNSADQNYSGGQQTANLKPTGGQNLFTYGMGMRTTF